MDKAEAEKVVKDWINSWYSSYADSEEEDQIEINRLYSLALLQFSRGEEFDFDGHWRNESDMEDEDFNEYMKPIYDALEILTDTKATEEYRQTYYSCCI